MQVSIERSRIPREVGEVAAELERNGFRAWIVGGCVRDLLLGRAVGDWDLATTARPEQMQKVFRRTIPTGIAHGTLTVLWKGQSYEVTTLRGEGAYTDGRHPDSVFFVDDIDRDLERRDFTVNALAFDLRSGTLVDPFGGLADLEARVLRAVRDPLLRFREDGLRVMRAARFCATLEFALDPVTEDAIRPTIDVLARVSRERVRDEWWKAMKAREPSRAFMVMRRTGILSVVAPPLDQADEAEFQRALGVLDRCVDPWVRHAALFTALGCGEGPSRTTDKLLAQLRYSNEERKTIAALVLHGAIVPRASLDRTAARRLFRSVGRPLLDRWLELGEAIAAESPEGSADAAWRASVEQELRDGMVFETKELRLRGDEIAAMVGGPGPGIRRALDDLIRWVDEDPARNQHDLLLAHVASSAESRTS